MSGWDTEEPCQNMTRGFGRGVFSSRDIDQNKSPRNMNKTFSPRGRGRGAMREADTNRVSGFSQTFEQNETGCDTVTLYIESSVIGRVIGKGGSNLREVEEQSGAQLKVSRDRSGGSVPVDVTGTPQQVATASQLIDQCTTGSQRQEGRNGFGGGQWSGAETSVTLQVESRAVGRIIGKGGSKIRQLQEDSGAHINVSRDKSGATVDVDLSGSEEQVARARQLIEELTDSAGDRGYGGDGFGRSGGGEDIIESRNEFGGGQWSGAGASVTLQVESHDVGRIIGKGGSKIRQLREDSGAQINVSRETSGSTVDVDLSGSAEQVAIAKQMIEELTDSAGDRGFGGGSGGGGFGRSGGGHDNRDVEFGGGQWSGEDASVTLQVESRDVGRIIGRGGSKIRQLQEDSGAQINVSRDKSGATVDVDLSGSAEQVARAKQLIEELTDSSGDRGFGGGGFGRSEQTVMHNRRDESRSGFGGDQWSSGGTSITLQVESRDVGRIIGKGGSKIRQLQEDSGAQINVSRDKSGATVDVDISGSAEEVAMAKELIEELTDSAGDRGYGGGGFGRSGGGGGEETVMEVDSRDVGKIIGRGGSRIRELQADSGASIEVSRDSSGPTVTVTLKGPEEERNRAKELIEDIINPEDGPERNSVGFTSGFT